MSELKVHTIESNNTLTANSVFAGNLVINSVGIDGDNYLINTSAVFVGNSTSNIAITNNIVTPSITISGTTYTSLKTETVNTQLC